MCTTALMAAGDPSAALADLLGEWQSGEDLLESLMVPDVPPRYAGEGSGGAAAAGLDAQVMLAMCEGILAKMSAPQARAKAPPKQYVQHPLSSSEFTSFGTPQSYSASVKATPPPAPSTQPQPVRLPSLPLGGGGVGHRQQGQCYHGCGCSDKPKTPHPKCALPVGAAPVYINGGLQRHHSVPLHRHLPFSHHSPSTPYAPVAPCGFGGPQAPDGRPLDIFTRHHIGLLTPGGRHSSGACVTKKNTHYMCGNCFSVGHNRRTCPNAKQCATKGTTKA